MTDAWDEEEFEVPDLGAGAGATDAGALNWEDEEEYEPPPLPPTHGSAPTLSKAKADKLSREADARRSADVESALQDIETADDRRIRERLDVEEADHELTDELFGGGGGGGAANPPEPVVVQGVDGYALKSLKDHITLAHDVCDRCLTVKSKPNYVHAMLKEMLKKLDGKLGPDELAEIIGICAASKLAKEKAAKQPTARKAAKAGNKPKGKSKKEIAAEKKVEQEKFGDFVEDEYETQYQNEYDDFM